MDQQIKELWTAALRSGEFEQTKGVLARLPEHDGDTPAGYCCLGVLCEIYARQYPSEMSYVAAGSEIWRSREYTFTDTSSRTDLPSAFMQMLNLTYDQTNMLVELNDEQDKSFVQIADWIDINL